MAFVAKTASTTTRRYSKPILKHNHDNNWYRFSSSLTRIYYHYYRNLLDSSSHNVIDGPFSIDKQQTINNRLNHFHTSSSTRQYSSSSSEDCNNVCDDKESDKNNNILIDKATELPSSSSASLLSLSQQIQHSLENLIFPEILGKNYNFEKEQKIILLLGVSGGCDSVALLHGLHEYIIQHQLQNKRTMIQLHVVHFNHEQRGKNSDLDEKLVRELCQTLQVPSQTYYFYKDETNPFNKKQFSQATAREWRQQYMYMHMKKLLQSSSTKSDTSRQIPLLVTAHHLNDSNETLLLKLLRGVHVLNLQGLAPFTKVQQQESPNDSNDNITMYWIRPLIGVTKEYITSYLLSNNYTWREDESNASNKYLRNRVRNELIPLVQDILGDNHEQSIFQKRLDNLQQQTLLLHQYVQDQVQTKYGGTVIQHDDENNINNNKWIMIPNDIKDFKTDLLFQQALFTFIVSKHPSFSYTQLQSLLQQLQDYPQRREWIQNIGNGWNVQRLGDILRVVPENDNVASMNKNNSNNAIIMKNSKILSWILNNNDNDNSDRKEGGSDIVLHIAKNTDLNKLQFVQTTCQQIFNYKQQIFVPPWRTNSQVKLKDFLRGQKVPLHLRDTIPVITIICENTNNDTTLPNLDDNGTATQKSNDETITIVAVCIHGSWIVNGRFQQSNNNDTIPILLSVTEK